MAKKKSKVLREVLFDGEAVEETPAVEEVKDADGKVTTAAAPGSCTPKAD